MRALGFIFLVSSILIGCGDSNGDEPTDPASGTDATDATDATDGVTEPDSTGSDAADATGPGGEEVGGPVDTPACAPFEGDEAAFSPVAASEEPGPHHALDCGRVLWATPKGGLRLFESHSGHSLTLIEDATSADDPLVRWPDIHENRIVYTLGDNPPQIMIRELGAPTAVALSPSVNAQLRPRISASRIAWEEEVDGVAQVHVYDRGTATSKRIDPTDADQRFVAVSGDRVVWTDFRKDDNRVWDADGGDETSIHGLVGDGAPAVWVDAPFKQAFADIDGDRLVWLDWRNVPHDENGYPRPEPKLQQPYEIWLGTIGADGVEETLFKPGGKGSYSGLPRLDGPWVAWASQGSIFGANIDDGGALINLSVGAPTATAPIVSANRLLYRSATGLKLVPLGFQN